ncbi:MAG: nitric oxide synthase [Sedimentibacter sp.]|uniref:flavodoxin family protein n=1 Tax=Sedimentibacter sp. TaxID=1960295 RepID=UPI0031595675
MKTLIVYDSVFGNTKNVALAMEESLKENGEAAAVHVGKFHLGLLEGVGVLVVGSPTRGFKPTKEIAGFLDKIPAGRLGGMKVMAFDTRSDVKKIDNKILNFMVKRFGYAAEPIGDKLVKKGGKLAKSPEGFIVSDTEGPMVDGEIERAKNWIKL